MALKRKITSEQFDALSEALKAEYVEDSDGYRLDVDGGTEEDNGALKRAKQRESELRKEAESKAKALAEKLAQLEGDDARKSGDIARLEKAWKVEQDKRNAAAAAKIEGLSNHVRRQLVDNVALQIANGITDHPNLILPHIKGRLSADLEGDGGPQTRVLDANGQISAMSVADLTAEFVGNPDFSAIIRASRASGGATKQPATSSGSALKPAAKPDLSQLSPKQLVEHINAIKGN